VNNFAADHTADGQQPATPEPRLPSLPSRRAILLGWAAPAPVLVEVQELPLEHRPHSPDPKFWDVWTGAQPCEVDWSKIASVWQQAPSEPNQDAGRQTADKDAESG